MVDDRHRALRALDRGRALLRRDRGGEARGGSTRRAKRSRARWTRSSSRWTSTARACCSAGFSQGAMISLDLALRSERPLAGLALMSATMLCASEWTALMPRRAKLPVMQSHGRVDPLLPYELAEKLRDSPGKRRSRSDLGRLLRRARAAAYCTRAAGRADHQLLRLARGPLAEKPQKRALTRLVGGHILARPPRVARRATSRQEPQMAEKISLEKYGIKVKSVWRNAAPAELYECGLTAESGTAITSTGALVALSGTKTGRSPQRQAGRRRGEHPRQRLVGSGQRQAGHRAVREQPPARDRLPQHPRPAVLCRCLRRLGSQVPHQGPRHLRARLPRALHAQHADPALGGMSWRASASPTTSSSTAASFPPTPRPRGSPRT